MASSLLEELKKALPGIRFEAKETFSWSPEEACISYIPSPTLDDSPHSWTLLHEASHAFLDHKGYENDIELLLLEVAAWHKAEELAESFSLKIDEEYMQDCLDTYRDWLHRRSTCPKCQTVSTQISPSDYRCYNCRSRWSVSASRFCRPYRRIHKDGKKASTSISGDAFRSIT